MDKRDFIANVSRALGRSEPPSEVQFDALYGDLSDAALAAERARTEALADREELRCAAVDSFREGGWKVHTASTAEDVGGILSDICEASGIRTAVRTTHELLEQANVGAVMAQQGVECEVMRRSSAGGITDSAAEAARGEIEAAKQRMFEVDAGITGGDYLIAETGTLAIRPGAGSARLASLAPAVHIAVVHANALLPSLDELFLLEHVDLLQGDGASGLNLISGPSRTGDIEATIVEGIHGPTETHLVLVG